MSGTDAEITNPDTLVASPMAEVDRGNPGTKAADIGAMELYAASVISSDPFNIAQVVSESLAGSHA